MNIRGIYKSSLIDYPGKIAVVVFNAECNFRCGFCHNPDLVIDSHKLEKMPDDDIIRFLLSRAKFIDGVVITGGEPTLSGDLPEFLKKIKEHNFFIKLDTNGSSPQVVEDLLSKNLLDYIALDIKTSPQLYSKLTLSDISFDVILKTLSIIKNSGIEYELRTTCIPEFINHEILKEIGELTGNVRAYYLQQFSLSASLLDNNYKNLVPLRIDYLNELLDVVKGFAATCSVRGI